MTEYKLMQPTKDVQRDITVMADKLVPMFNEFWDARGRKEYGLDLWTINPVLLTDLWMNKALILILAQEGETPVGFLMGFRTISFFRRENAVQVEAYYGRTPEIEDGLIDYLDKAFQFFPEKVLSLPLYDRQTMPKLSLASANTKTLGIYNG
jgi:hypothetical protein